MTPRCAPRRRPPRSDLVPEQPPRAAVIIPNYNGGQLTAACVEAILADPSTSCRRRIIVVDDASPEDVRPPLADVAPDIELVEQPVNTGFAGACNAGARAAGDCDYLVFLNNDTIPSPGWLDALVDEAEADPEIAAVGAKLLYPNGQVQHAGVVIHQSGLPYHAYTGFDGAHPAVNRARDVTAATAACLLVRRADFEDLRGFDTGYRNGYEDVDLCLRLREHGKRIRYCPRSVVVHLESVTRFPSGVSTGVETSERLYAERWQGKVTPDDVQRYLDDGLLAFEWGPNCPLTVRVAPELAVIRHDDGDVSHIERLLQERSEQVFEMLSAQTRRLLRERADLGKRVLSGVTPARVTRICGGRVHRLGDGGRLISIAIPVKNGAPHLRQLLDAVLAQAISCRLEIIAVDSGSQDDGREILRRAGATVFAIPPSDFDHGLTRNLLAERAQGEVIVFMTQMATPADDRWLAPLLAALDADPRIVGACSRVVPHSEADLLTRRDGLLDLSGSSERSRKQIDDWPAYERLTAEERRRYLNFHTVSAAIRTEAVRRTPFRSVRTLGEDLLWAREVVESGWALVHEPASAVYHSHDYTVGELLGRSVDDGVANRDIIGRSVPATQIVPQVRAMVSGDWAYLRDELGLEGEDLAQWQVEAVLRRAAQTVGQWVGANHETLPRDMVTLLSYIARARGGEAPLGD